MIGILFGYEILYRHAAPFNKRTIGNLLRSPGKKLSGVCREKIKI